MRVRGSLAPRRCHPRSRLTAFSVRGRSNRLAPMATPTIVRSGFAGLALALALGCGGGGSKQKTTPSGGEQAAPTGTTTGEAPEGGAVATAGDPAKGASVFADACSTCHGDSGEGNKQTPAVVGPGSLQKFADDKALFDYLKEKMPKDDPGSLSDEEYRNVIAWMRKQ